MKRVGQCLQIWLGQVTSGLKRYAFDASEQPEEAMRYFLDWGDKAQGTRISGTVAKRRKRVKIDGEYVYLDVLLSISVLAPPGASSAAEDDVAGATGSGSDVGKEDDLRRRLGSVIVRNPEGTSPLGEGKQKQRTAGYRSLPLVRKDGGEAAVPDGYVTPERKIPGISPRIARCKSPVMPPDSMVSQDSWRPNLSTL